MKLPFITIVMACWLILSSLVPVGTVWAQNETDDVYFEAEGLLTSVSGDIFYINQTPFRLTEFTHIIMPAGYEVKFLVYEDDLTAMVRYRPDKASGGRDIPQAVLVKLAKRLPQ